MFLEQLVERNSITRLLFRDLGEVMFVSEGSKPGKSSEKAAIAVDSMCVYCL